ncbi:WD40 repeat-like protein [Rhodotorula sp. JG-1b]|nr:WD40 repeat-like protein [Rhodotorula sp. JG-1b]
MNVDLLNPFSTSVPENFDSSVDAAALCARFNPRGLYAGHYIAVGRLDGVVAVIDFETKNIVRWLEGHVKAVTTVCWSGNSRYLLTAARDWNVIIWDLSAGAADTLQGERRHTVRFDAPITSAALHPRNSKLLVVTLHGQTQPVFVDLRDEGGGRWELEPPPDEDEMVEDEDEEMETIREISTYARFNPRGDLIYVGTSRGNIHIWDVQTKEASLRIPLWVSMQRGLTGVASSDAHALVLNSQDRCIRYITLSPFPPSPPSDSEDEEAAAAFEPPPPRPPRIPYFTVEHKFQDLVNRTPWNGCAGNKGAHNIYIWDRETGTLVKILEGPKDSCEDLDWHPFRPLIASVSSHGFIHLWVTPIVENWSAYAPGFEELDENREYEEKEDEFDFEDENAIRRRAADAQDHPVDIVSHPARTIVVEPWPDDDPAGAEAYEAFVRRGVELDEDADPPASAGGGSAFYPEPLLLPEGMFDEAPVESPSAGGRR